MKRKQEINKLFAQLRESEAGQGNRRINPGRIQSLTGVNQSTVNRWLSGETDGGERAVMTLKALIWISKRRELNAFELGRE